MLSTIVLQALAIDLVVSSMLVPSNGSLNAALGPNAIKFLYHGRCALLGCHLIIFLLFIGWVVA